MAQTIRKKLNSIFIKIDKLATKGKDKIWEYYDLVDEFINRGDFDNFTQTLYYYYLIDVSKYRNDISEIKKRTWPEILFITNNSFQKRIKKVYDKNNVYQQGFDVWSDSVMTLGLTASTPLSSTYSITSSTQSVYPSRVGDHIYFTINDSNIYSMELFKCEWYQLDGVEQPLGKSIELFQRFKILATQSTYLTEMSIYHGRDYLIRTQSRNSNLQLTQLNYKLSVSRNLLLGQIVEIESYEDNVNYFYKSQEFAKLQGIKKTYLEVNKTGTQSVYVTYNNPELTEDQNLLKRYEFAIGYLLH